MDIVIDILVAISVNSGAILALGGAFLIFRLQTKRDEIISLMQRIKELKKELEELESKANFSEKAEDIKGLFVHLKKDCWLEECDKVSLEISLRPFLQKLIYLFGLLTLFGSTMLLSLLYFIFGLEFHTLFIYFIFSITTILFFIYLFYEIMDTSIKIKNLEEECERYNIKYNETENRLEKIYAKIYDKKAMKLKGDQTSQSLLIRKSL